jgi:DNA-binding protein HU-beta
MNKQELIEAIAKDTDLSKAKAGEVLDSLIANVEKSLKKGNDVQLVGFGTWKRKKRNARAGRNPQTGATIKIAARKVPVFVAGKKLKDAVQ